jgi:hypothetical protein
MNERRRFLRQNRCKPGHIRFQRAGGPEVVGCLVKDESANGAQLLFASTSDIPSEFRLTTDGIDDQACMVKWRSPDALGVEFVVPQPLGVQPTDFDRAAMPVSRLFPES